MRWIARPMTRLVGATVFAAMVTGMTLPNAIASSARHSAQATCTATGTYAVGQSTHKHEDSNSAGMMSMMPGGGGTSITGTIVLASYTTCGT
ncbi:MAG: hypothetical protein JWO42_3002, partial [Chloroflexi bacterium]|nr:hypothetical protein [Chloroflexota bacterium]